VTLVAPVSGFVRMVLMVLLVCVFIVGYMGPRRIRVIITVRE
jgi:hypothetical protein